MHRKLAAQARHSSLLSTIAASAAEHIGAPSDSFDTVVATLVLCSVANLDAALRDMRRVLRPGGQLLFIEHVGATAGSRRLRWQRRLQPLWRRLAGNCHLARPTVRGVALNPESSWRVTCLGARRDPYLMRTNSSLVRDLW